ncbi:MAG: hypothetical protein AB1801_17430 [Chloroflexota bacterium]
MFDRIVLLLTGLVAAYVIWRFYTRYAREKSLYDVYYLLGFVVLLVSGVLLILFGYGILASPYVLTVATLIPLGISLGLMNQFYPEQKKIYAWFALIGFLAIAVTSIMGLPLKKVAVPLFHGVAGLIIFGVPILSSMGHKTAKDFWWVGVGGVLIGLGGIALAFLSVGSQLLFFSQQFVLTILAPLLLLMTLAFTWGFTRDILQKP